MKRPLPVLLIVLAAAVAAASCGGSSSPTPTAPAQTTPPPPANRAPSIVAMSFAPSFGIMGFTQFAFSVSASDPDGDPLTYAWDVAGNPFTGTSGTILFSSGGTGTARVTVSDNRGLSATDSRTFTVGSMTGSSTVISGQLVGSSFNLTQNTAGIVTGTFNLPGIGNGQTDPAQPGRIDGNGNLQMRVKVGAFTDFTMAGTMDNTGRRVSGTLQGSGFTGQPFVMTK
jgi:hypothetical protein